ncbi:TetR/AcrR family transcriptional regulator [Streptomyces sp. I05A-00742]|uniref:TetR/AcrR family transcriptional regulator n=1 Tax=Streptomyces sp. I05A-00742 TaxID=2732853 RepID=UPI001487C305|nr:TetR/AcrR family transcriptional regulator [Streptomyces sp. I05A-00742]
MATKQRGRPRSFDRATALEQAIMAFWEHGYEATSIADLTRTMGIGAPSLYAAFGDKKALFTAAVEEYGHTYGAFVGRALAEEPTARRGIERMLREAAVEYTAPGRPHGCLVISAATNTTEASADVVASLREQREANVRAMERAIEADKAAGELPDDADPRALARFAAVAIQGMSQQARDGVSREELEAVAELALRVWPEARAAETVRR